MRDAVREELERRWAEPWPWRSALLVALALHLSVAALLALAPSRHRRALQLPSVHVRMVAAPPAPAARPAAAPSAGATERRTVPPPRRAAKPKASPPPVRSAAKQPEKPAEPSPASASGQTGGAVPPSEATQAGPAGGDAPAPSGAIGLGAGNGGTDEPFPFTYYLERFIGAVESNWFRPPAPADSRCRVRCRIDRSGRLLEAGIEEPSGVPAFDRAALRAVFASAPFPPLPQGFGGQSLTLHLDFGP